MNRHKYRKWVQPKDKNDKGYMDYDPKYQTTAYVVNDMPNHEAKELIAYVWLNRIIAETEGILMQYTGLKDVRGKEIYTGDIVEWSKGLDDIGEIRSGTGCVKFHPEYLRYDIGVLSEALNKEEDRGTIMILSRVRYHVVIIGNVFENPELLKTKND